eukprot:1342423-Alexandrium_andersonii.AAC.1
MLHEQPKCLGIALMRSWAFLDQRASLADNAMATALRRCHRRSCTVRFLSRELIRVWTLLQPVSIDAVADMNTFRFIEHVFNLIMDMAVTDGDTGAVSAQHALRRSGDHHIKRVIWPLGAETALL